MKFVLVTDVNGDRSLVTCMQITVIHEVSHKELRLTFDNGITLTVEGPLDSWLNLFGLKPESLTEGSLV